MSKIKVGQVYKYTDVYLQTEQIIAVTYLFRCVACCLARDGETHTIPLDYFDDYTLIAEYPTWQEAVNSKEFNDVEIHN